MYSQVQSHDGCDCGLRCCFKKHPENRKEARQLMISQNTGRGCHAVNKRDESSSEVACLHVCTVVFCSPLQPLSLFKRHHSVSCRVAGSGSTRQQLPVCS